MIKFLIPLGLLAFLSILVLILIYIIKPNYQLKYISGTQIWIESLKYRKKRLNTNLLRNILIFLCQVLILSSIALALADPVNDGTSDELDVIVVMDSSASMLTESNGITRYERAVRKATEFINETANTYKNSKLSVIRADASPEFLGMQYEPARCSELITLLQETDCSYETMDINKVLECCETLMDDNHKTEIYFYTDTEFVNSNEMPEQIHVVNDFMENTEWNASILTAYATRIDNFYSIYVDVASYGDAMPLLTLKLDVSAIKRNEGGDVTEPVSDYVDVQLENGVTKHVVFFVKTESMEGGNYESKGNYIYHELSDGKKFSAFNEIKISLVASGSDTAEDSFVSDDTFYVYGGNPETIKMAYISDEPCRFFQVGLANIRNFFGSYWNFDYTEINVLLQDLPITSGYDFYFFENAINKLTVTELPMDGVSVFIEPTSSSLPTATQVTCMSGGMTGAFTPRLDHSVADGLSLLNDLNLEALKITRYTPLMINANARNLMKQVLVCDNSPALIVRKDGMYNYVIASFGVHYSNFPRLRDWPIFLANVFEYYFPKTIDKFEYDAGEEISFNSRAQSITISYKDDEMDFFESDFEETTVESFPYTQSFITPGTYRIKQKSVYATQTLNDLYFYIRMPSEESNIYESTTFPEFYFATSSTESYDYLWIWLAAALVALLFAEWVLHYRESK